jgi:hypothetical protein
VVQTWTSVPQTGWSVIAASLQGSVVRTGFQRGATVVDVHVGCGTDERPTFQVDGPTG